MNRRSKIGTMNMWFKIICLGVVAFCLVPLCSQSNFVTTGGTASGSGGSATFSIGQIDYVSVNNGYFINQGLQQPQEFFVNKTIKNTPTFNITCYPNPSSKTLYFSSDLRLTNAKIILFDLTGKKILTEVFSSKINIENIAAGLYLLQIIDNNAIIFSSEIIKG